MLALPPTRRYDPRGCILKNGHRHVPAQSLQNVSSLDGGNYSQEQTELKESETHLSLHSASQSTQAHLTQACVTSIERPFPESCEWTYSSTRRRNCQVAPRELLTKAKERGNRRRYKERYPILCAFLAIFAKTGQGAHPKGLNLLEAR